MATIDGQQVSLNNDGDLKALTAYANRMQARYKALRDGATTARFANQQEAEINASTVYTEQEKATLISALAVRVKYAKQNFPALPTIDEAREVVAGTRDSETWEVIRAE